MGRRIFLVIVTLDDGSGFIELPIDAITVAQSAAAINDVRRSVRTEEELNLFLVAIERHHGTAHMVAAHRLATELSEASELQALREDAFVILSSPLNPQSAHYAKLCKTLRREIARKSAAQLTEVVAHCQIKGTVK